MNKVFLNYCIKIGIFIVIILFFNILLKIYIEKLLFSLWENFGLLNPHKILPLLQIYDFGVGIVTCFIWWKFFKSIYANMILMMCFFCFSILIGYNNFYPQLNFYQNIKIISPVCLPFPIGIFIGNVAILIFSKWPRYFNNSKR